MKTQSGYLFHKGTSWFVRYYDDLQQPDGSLKRKLVCRKLDVEYGGEHRTKKSVRPFADEILAPINSGKFDVRSTMLVSDFVEKIYLTEYAKKQLRPVTHRSYQAIWKSRLKGRMGNMTLRAFRTVDGEEMLAGIARQSNLGRHSLKHIKSFLSGIFKQAKRLGILDGVNPIQDVSIPRVAEPKETYAYSLSEIRGMLAKLKEPAYTVVLTAALTGLRKSELLGLRWQDYDGAQLSVNQSIWNGIANEPKTRRSRAPIPVVRQLADALDAHKLRAGKLAQSGLPIFQAGNGKPLNMDNLARRVIAPSLSCCVVCHKEESEHKPEGHVFEQDKTGPQWHGWHAFRRGLATNLHALGVDDKTIQTILRHSNINLTMNVYVKTVSESQTAAMDSLSEKLGVCNGYATRRVQ
jgi:integrase